MVTKTITPDDNIVEVLPEVNAIENESEIIATSRRLTVSLSTFGDSQPHSIAIAHGNTKNALTITLNRTIRVPDNQDTNALPPSCGQFPLYRIRDYAHNLPDDMVQKGGLFFPMYQCEAMWISFHANHPFAIKIYVGGVNAVSGFPMTENDATREKRARMLREDKQIQDYMVVPEQPWLDGIVSEDGKIRQFVAQPKGSGFAVEAQVTGEEKVGGIQVEIIPVRRNTPTEFDVRYEDRENKVVTRTFKFADRGITAESTWEDVKKIIRNEFDIAVADQMLSDHGASNNVSDFGPHRRLPINFADDTKLGDVYFPPNFSTLSVKNRPPPVARNFARGRRAGGDNGLQSSPVFGSASPAYDMEMACASAMPLPEEFAEEDQAFGSLMSVSAPSGPKLARAAAPKIKRKVKEMGIAAGGLITQTINPDAYPADSWDASASVMLNLQILDAASYCAVTGLPPPSTPVNGEEYAKHGYPYFEIWNEEKTGVQGDFAEVKSVAQLEKERALAEGRDAPPEEKSVPVRIVKIGGRPRSFKTTFRPLEVLTKELEGLHIQPSNKE
ncbi:hypothetical protein ACHAQA_008172 [Verticillium albo-atrum]